MEEKPIPLWQKVVAGLVVIAVVVVVIVFHTHIGPDFFPLDKSTVGPNILASIIQWAVLFVAAVFLYPPWRRRVHRFVDGKLESIHAKLGALHGKVDHLDARHDEHAAHLDALSQRIEDLHDKFDNQ
jgi:uncharacterized membrane protein YccC